MSIKRKLLHWSIIIILTCLGTVIFVNQYGNHIQSFETKVYRKITGKKKQFITTDTAGIPYVVYEGNIGDHYNPITVAEYILKLQDSSDSSFDKNFWNSINWLKNNNKYLNDTSIIFETNFDWPTYGMISPWRSAMSQGRAIQAFIKAFMISGDSTFLDLSVKSMNTLFTTVDKGGVTYIDSTGYWFEEYADDGAAQSRVLNGMIVVLQALSDFHDLTGNSNSLFLLNKGILAVRKSISIYDNDGHSCYDIHKKPASAWYHKFHIELLGFLYDKTGDEIFNEYRQKWLQYKEPSYISTLYRKPTRIGVFTILSVFSGILVLVSVVYGFLRQFIIVNENA